MEVGDPHDTRDGRGIKRGRKVKSISHNRGWSGAPCGRASICVRQRKEKDFPFFPSPTFFSPSSLFYLETKAECMMAAALEEEDWLCGGINGKEPRSVGP